MSENYRQNVINFVKLDEEADKGLISYTFNAYDIRNDLNEFIDSIEARNGIYTIETLKYNIYFYLCIMY